MVVQEIPWQISLSPRFELFLALWSASSDRARRHAAWRAGLNQRLRPEFHQRQSALGGAPELWILFFDACGLRPPEDDIAQVLVALRRRSAAELAQTLLATLLHSGAVAERVIAGTLAITEALAQLPRRKREWLGFMGLYPYEADRPMARTVARMIADPDGFRGDALAAIDMFVADVFAADWRRLRPQLARASAAAGTLLKGGDWPAIGRALGLNVEFDLARREIRALRGGYALSFAAMGRACFLPSAFNELQFWTVLEHPTGRTDPLIPFLDGSARLTIEPHGDGMPATPLRDVALVFRALGDATRFAMAGLLARRPMSSAELARQLGIAKPTVAHHIHELRQAGLLSEEGDGKAIILSLDRAAIEALSGSAVRQLFEGTQAPVLARSRRRS